MPEFQYKALTQQGGPTSGVVQAETRQGAITALSRRGIFVTDLREHGTHAREIRDVSRFPAKRGEAPAAQTTGNWEASLISPGASSASDGAGGAQSASSAESGTREPSAPSGWSFLRRRRLSLRARAGLLRQVGTALRAGLPLLQALRVVEEQAESPATRDISGDLARRVQSGESLSFAMEAHERDFSHLDVSMVRVGETAGVLDQVMGHLTEFAEREIDVREKIRSAAVYPIFVLCLAGVSVVIVMTVILPRVLGSMTEDLTARGAMPAPTAILMAVTGAVASYWWLMLAAIGLGVWGFRRYVRRPEGQLAVDRLLLRLPVLGVALRRLAAARFARTLGTLSKSGIQILEALRVLRGTLGNEFLARELDRVSAGVTQGQSIAEPLRQTGQFPPLLIQVIAMGERTGKLDELLLQTAEAYEKETAVAIQRVMTILPAVFIVLLALVVGFILAAVLLPIVGMETSVPGM